MSDPTLWSTPLPMADDRWALRGVAFERESGTLAIALSSKETLVLPLSSADPPDFGKAQRLATRAPASALAFGRVGARRILAAGCESPDLGPRASALLWHAREGAWSESAEPVAVRVSLPSALALVRQETTPLLIVAGGEYHDRLTVWRLVDGVFADQEPARVLKGPRCWASRLATASLGADRVLIAASGRRHDDGVFVWNAAGDDVPEAPSIVLRAPRGDWEHNWVRDIAAIELAEGGALLFAAVGADADEYGAGDAGYLVLWSFDEHGEVQDAEPLVMQRFGMPVGCVDVARCAGELYAAALTSDGHAEVWRAKKGVPAGSAEAWTPIWQDDYRYRSFRQLHLWPLRDGTLALLLLGRGEIRCVRVGDELAVRAALVGK